MPNLSKGFIRDSGFTLLELMIVIVIIGIFAAIAIPTYRHYVQESQRSAAESQMQGLAGDLERWRAKNLHYSGFLPINYATSANCATATSPTCYVDHPTNSYILLPIGSTAASYTYKIYILDGACRSSLYSSVTGCAGQSWVMIALPNTALGYMASASSLVLDSQGVRCMANSLSSDLGTLPATTTGTFTSTNDAALCGTTSTPWR